MKAGSPKSCPSCGERYDTDVLFCPKDGTPLASARNPSVVPSDRDPYVGTELPGQIRVDTLIGIGSMGRVYRAFQGGIERDVAVKILHRELSGNAELTGRFHREAKVASRLVHPNVVQVLMTGALPAGMDARTGGELYLVMEYLDGISLLSALAAAGEGAALPLPRALHIALQICDAVGEAHAQGIVHRDMKPENVMLVRRGDDPDYVKVLDFGIARLDWADRAMATQAGLIFGTAKYISPEGAEGHHVGPPADVYSIATMLYQMLAGRTPFEGDSPVALLVQHTHAPPLYLRTIARASYVPEPLAAAIMQNLAKRPEARAANARQFARDLVAAARASGLYPEEIATQSTLFSPTSLGAVKLASKERTKAHELSADLAARIGGVAAKPVGYEGVERVTVPTPTLPTGQSPDQHEDVDSSELIPDTAKTLEHPALASAPPPRPSRNPSAPPAGRSRPGYSQPPVSMGGDPYPPPRPGAAGPTVAMEEESPISTLPGAPLLTPGNEQGPHTTMQGTETTLDGPSFPGVRARRARTARLAAIVACALVATPVVVLGGRKLGGFGAVTTNDSAEAALDEARDCMRRRAWDVPATHNFKEITDVAVARWPQNSALADLRREAAELLVHDALARKYANDPAEAKHLVELALHFDPLLTTAQHLAAELAGPRAPDIAPAASTSATADHGKSGHHPRDPHADARPPTGPRPPASSAPPVAPPTGGGAVLPPPPAPRPPGDAPAPSATGPWL
jgi:serine/threonine-protein kinase